ncbi:MAG: cell division protein ZapA [Acetobacteraceae bacterium]
MAQVTLRINGYPYVLGCPDGEEGHLETLGAELDARVGAIRAQVGNLGEARLLVMAGIMLADELRDLKAAKPRPAAPASGETAERLSRLAARLEGVATRLARP